VRNIRKRWAEGDLETALTECLRPGARRKVDARGEAMLIALACSHPLEGREHWTMQLVAERLVELGVVEPISRGYCEAGAQTNGLKPWQKQQWGIATVTADFIWRMEDVLDLYAEPYAPKRPMGLC
jgi:uncharacterized protein YlxP (DUF503 family)